MELKFSEDIIDKEELKKLWAKNIRPTVLYLHNPFCIAKENCHYCMHKGCPAKDHTKEEVNNFYFNYMPKLLRDFYGDIIEQQEIKLMSFGGGTPNYLSSEDFKTYMQTICELHPKLRYIPKVKLLLFSTYKSNIDC